MVFRRSGFSRVETLPFGAMVCKQSVSPTCESGFREYIETLRETASTAMCTKLAPGTGSPAKAKTKIPGAAEVDD